MSHARIKLPYKDALREMAKLKLISADALALLVVGSFSEADIEFMLANSEYQELVKELLE